MAPLIDCPVRDVLRRLLLGQLPGPEGDQLAHHLEQCEHCAATIRTLRAEDTLIEAARARAAAEDGPEADTVRGLVDQLCRLGPPGHAVESGVMGRAVPTRVMDGPPASLPEAGTSGEYDFLSAPQGPGELGRLGQYRVLKVLGSGGMGIVFQAEDLPLKRQVALKMMKPEAALKRTARERFLREARATAALEHENIVAIYHVSEENGVPFLVMPMLKGMSLEERLRQGGPLPISQVLQLGQQLATGLQAAHEAGLVHRDIKPGNVWLETTAGHRPAASGPNDKGLGPIAGVRIKILDFGLAHADDDVQLTQSGAIVGSPLYMAPEQARGEKADLRCDLFSLGVVLYQMGTGQVPFRGSNLTAMLTSLAVDTVVPPQRINPAMPLPLAALIGRLLAKDPAGRPASAAEVAQRLQALEQQLVSSASSPTDGVPPAPPSRSVHRRRLLIAAVALLALLPLCWFFGGTVIRVATNKGELIIETDDPNIEVTIKGQSTTIYDKVKDRRFVLTAGDYELEVREVGEGEVRFTTKKFTITRGGKETLNVRLEPTTPGPTEVKPVAAGDERKATEWALSLGGKVTIRVADKEQEIAAARDLPAGAWQLLHIDFTDNQRVTDADLAHVAMLPNLRSLNLTRTQVSDAGLIHLKGLTNLTLLGLTLTKVRDAGLVHLKGLTNLVLLDLPGTQVGDAGLVHLKGLTNLTQLHLGGTQVRDTGLIHLKMLTNLKKLYLNHTQVSDAGLIHLKGRDIWRLWLSDTRVSDASLGFFLSQANLQELDLRGARVSTQGFAALKAAFPRAQLSWSEPNRTAVEAVLALGGSVGIRSEAGERLVKAVADLPAHSLRLTRVDLAGTGKSLSNLAPKLGALTDSTFDSLETLDLSKTAVSDADLQWLAKLTRLTELDLRGTRVSDAGLKHLKGLTQLQMLWLRGTGVTDAGLEHLKTLTHLTTLDLVDNRVSDRGLVHLRTLSDLQWLWLDGAQVSDTGLAHLEALTKLLHLTLSGTRVSDAGLVHLKAMPSLKSLSLRDTQVSSAGLKHLTGLTDLTSLDLNNTRMNNDGLDSLKTLNNLEQLYLHSTQVSDAGLVHLQALTRLKVLHLGKTPVGDVGLAHLKGLSRLRELFLIGTQVSDNGLGALKGLSELRQLDLTGTKVTAKGATGLRKALPRCEVHISPAPK